MRFQDEDKNEYLRITPDLGLYFPAVDYMMQEVLKLSADKSMPIVIDFSNVLNIDYTAAEVRLIAF